MESELSYWASQSAVTNPGALSRRVSDLPSDLAGLRQVARGLILHYRAENPTDHGISEERLAEIDSRYAETMLGRLFELADRPLSEPRSLRERLVGCCRDFTVLFLTMARELGIPARARVGFAAYFIPGFNLDHEVAEVWDAHDRAGVSSTPSSTRTTPTRATARISTRPTSPAIAFSWGGGLAALPSGPRRSPDVRRLPHLELEMLRSWPYLRHNLIHDLAALNKAEMLLWDSWGLMERDEPAAEGDVQRLDRVAEATASADLDLSELRRLYDREPDLRVPAEIVSYNPLGGPPRTVALQTH